ncbi:uncharacterized protein [Mytilus edulis]|uniref:uncharacterized protein isoform X1 n=1 Tax=Mytilus edulis TaxID=6550 RepID=UPI0039EECAEE
MCSWNLCVNVLTVLFVINGLTNARLKRGRYPQFNDFCTSKDVYVGAPWDCSGYIHCQSGNGIKMTFWIECPAGLYFNLKHKTCMWPQDVSNPCPPVKDVVDTYCPQYPRAKLVHDKNCARYYDCSDFGNKRTPYLKECPYPQLFNTDTLTCDDYKYVECEERYRPVTPCDYKLSQCRGPNCPPCESQQVGCEGHPNGAKAYPGRLLTEYFLVCFNNKTKAIKTCTDTMLFDPIQGKCTLDLDPMALDVYCASSVDAKIAHPRICSRYYDCKLTRPRENFNKYEGECRYPLLYSERYQRCIDFSDVQCGSKIEPLSPCEYGQNSCFGRNCPRCGDGVIPSCVGLPDGQNPFPGYDNRYLVCRMDRTVETRTCNPGELFSQNLRGCSTSGSGLANPGTPDQGSGTSPLEPVLPFRPVRPPVQPPFQPPVQPPVRPPVRPPVQPPTQPPVTPPFFPTRPPTGPTGPIIPPIGSGPCAGNPLAIQQDPDNCARYYNCSQRITFQGLNSFQAECPYPQLFDTTLGYCNDFPAVTCGRRFEAMSPCDYVTTRNSCQGESCAIPCEERSPSCVGMADGNNTFPGRELTPFYMTCLRNRTLSVGICKYGVYDPTKKYCTTDLDPYSVQVFCQDKPNIKFPHIANCARYYDCGAIESDPVFGKYQRECTYPTLFNIDLLRCVPPVEADCQWRYEPKDPCGFLGNQRCDVNDRNCVPCVDTLNICAGVMAGNIPIVDNKMEYAVCKQGRFFTTVSCAPYSFNPSMKGCETAVNTCEGLPNGKQSMQGSESNYVLCFNQNVVEFGSCEPLLFDARSKQCSQQQKSKCSGLSDGNYPTSNIFQYIVCTNGRQTSVGDCSPSVFDSRKSICVKPEFSCERMPDGNYGHEDGTTYYGCVKGSFAGKNTCSPDVFDFLEGKCLPSACRGKQDGRFALPGSDIHYMTCTDQEVVKVRRCKRYRFDESLGRCTKSPSFCSSLQDGWHQMKEMFIYMYCVDKKPTKIVVCPAEVFDTVNGVCLEGYTPSDPVTFCENNPTAIMLHPESCARYVDCRNRNTLIGNYQEECAYPQLFDSFNNSCKPYREVKCGNRPEPKAPCDYQKQKICVPVGNCRPCELDNPNCVGKRDGPQAVPNKPEYFMQCKDERTISVTQCPPTAPNFDVTSGSCTVTLNPLNPGPYCEANPTAVVPHPDNCAQYIDCRQKNTPLGNYRQECPYPQLVSLGDATGLPCKTFQSVQCGARPEPKNACDYEQNLICRDPTNCIPCDQRFPSCYGMPDGNHPFPNQPNKYIVCLSDRTLRTETCKLGQFDPLTGSCSVKFDPSNPQAFCNLNSRAKVEDPTSCAIYYDCSSTGSSTSPYKQECPYPQLYSTTSQSCELFTKVNCGERYMPVKPCEYLQNQCIGPGGEPALNCEPCVDRLPSCIGLQDGNNTFPGRQNTPYYITCYLNRTILVRTCEDGVYDQTSRACMTKLDPANPALYCRSNPLQKIANPNNCAQFYDCSKPTGRFGAYLYECQYPQLFNDVTGNCVVFGNVKCGNRFLPQSPCQYQGNQCSPVAGQSCEPCEQRLPSCIGKLDGNNTITGRELTADYVVCFMNRTVSVESCPAGYFEPTLGECRTSIGAAAIRAFCIANPGVIRANPVNCAQYFDCGEASIRARTFLRECPYPMLFDTQSNTCQNYTSVTCGSRTEYTAPCDYLQNRCNPSMSNCRPCRERFASCIGMTDGLHPFPNRTMSPDFIVCNRGRTVSVEKCLTGLFDPGARICTRDITEDMIKSHCTINPSTIQPHLYQCAQYFDCGPTIGGSYLRECKYPQLFDTTSMTCQNFSDVTCGPRIEPQAPCDYLQNHCPPNVTNCVPCEDRLPTCKSLNDGNNAYPGRPVSEYYINCFSNRTVSVEACQVSLYDPVRRRCSSKINSGVLTKFCQDNPRMVIPDPANCARYYNCSDPSLAQGLDEPYRQECKYPRLFQSAGVGCQLFTMVRCQKNRYVPKTPCEYVENQCFNSTCEPCETRFPSCVGKVDGSNEFPGRENTEFYIVCYRERTVAIVSCTIGTYSHADRACVGEVTNSTEIIAPSPARR